MNIKVYEYEMTDERAKAVEYAIHKFHLYEELAKIVARVCDNNKEKIDLFMCSENKPRGFKGITDIEKAAKIIHKHIKENSNIRIIGDYDVDGITSTAEMYLTLKELGCNVSYYLPNRKLDGYGINVNIVKKCIEDNVNLIITVDNGTVAFDPVDLAKNAGIDVVITDHHKVGDRLPNADAIVNLQRDDNTYGYADLAGAGIVYKVIQALFVEMKLAPPNDLIQKLYALASMGTICDVMELKGENRDIVIKGLKALKGNVFPQLGEFAKSYSVGTIGYQIGPRLNACGRLESADIGFEYLIGADLRNKEQINYLNARRQEIEKIETERIMSEVVPGKNIYILITDELEEGVTGLVANNIKEETYRPTIVFAKQDGKSNYKASGRSIEEYNLYEGVLEHIHLLEGGGGHSMACGLKASNREQVEDFRIAMEESTKDLTFPDVQYIKSTIFVNDELDVENISLTALNAQLKILAPFGKGNPAPSFLLKNVTIRLNTRYPKNYIVTEILLKDMTGTEHKMVIWGDETLPECYEGEVDLVISVKNDSLTVKHIDFLGNL